ncbi:MAG: bifunctional precorrin-2 dehydrogenase/sirohydrochlorin ferrochelatase [Campylobacterota bacterium]|nr:bifunctional precorrin-2 dehydrogenase/sirohydrochlorin ferrochelatase [Campylobacterota bacterium]
MSYLPTFIKLDNKKVLIVGGGNIATRKLEYLLDFTSNIKVISPQISENMKRTIDENSLLYENRLYNKLDIENFAIVVVAVNDIALQEEIYKEAKLLSNCLVNSVDSVNYCDFIFPSYIKKDDLTIAVSTSGSSPAMAKYLRRYLQKLIPNSIGEFLKEMKNYRETIPKGKERMEFLDKKVKQYISTWDDIKDNK